MNINEWYAGAVRSILVNGSREMNVRTGVEVSALPGLTYQTDLAKEGFPILALRKINIINFIAEQMWFVSGSNDINQFLSAHTKIWNTFAEENGTVTSAYGYRWRHHFRDPDGMPVDQLAMVLQKLKRDKSSRHGVVMMWDPGTDLIVPQKNVPCPYTFTLNIIGGKLHLHLVVRSNDMVLGFPTDVAGFALLQYFLAQYLEVGVGTYTHSISNAHVYQNHYDAAALMVKRQEDEYGQSKLWNPIHFKLPKFAYQRAKMLDHTLLDETINNVSGYQPMEHIKGLLIAI